MKPPKLTFLLLAALLMSSCSATSSGINATFIALIVRIFPFSIDYFGGVTPASQSDSGTIDVWVAESASGTALSNFTYFQDIVSPAAGVPILTGVVAGGITAFYGMDETSSTMYLWSNGTIYIFTGNNRTATTAGTINVAPNIQNVTIDPGGTLGYVTAAGSTKLFIADLNAKTVLKTIDFGAGAIPNATAVWQDPMTGLTTVYVVDSAGSYHTVNPSAGTWTTTNLPTQGIDSGIPAVSPDGNQLWIPYPAGSVLAFETQGNSVVADFSDLGHPSQVVFDLTGASAYVLDSPSSGTGSIYSIATQTPFGTNWQKTIGTRPMGLVLSPYGSFLSVANSGDGNISQISTYDGQLMSLKAVGQSPVGVVMLNEPAQ